MSPTLGNSSTQQRWVPPSFRVRDLSIDPNDSILRKTRSILNKLTPEKFDKLCQEILNIGIDNKAILKGIVILIYEKAIDELRYSSLYANLCRRLYHEAPNFDINTAVVQGRPAPKPNTLRRILIAKLQDEFENRNKKLELFDSKEGDLTPDEEEQKLRAKQHMLGNIKFIGELYRLGLLHESIVHKCIKQLINKKKKGTVDDLAEDLECLCQIMTTCGRRLDHEKAKLLMDQYFDRLKKLQKRKTELPSRIRFMLQDVIELRAAGWVPRSIYVPQGPKTLGEIRDEVEEMYPSLVYESHGYRQSQSRPPKSNFEDHKVAAGLGFFPMSKKQQYDGFGMPSSPPLVPPANGEPTSPGPDFDFFSSPPNAKNNTDKQLGKSTASHNQFAPPYMNQMNQRNGNHTSSYVQPSQFRQPQPQMAYNGYGMRYPSPGFIPSINNPQQANRPTHATPSEMTTENSKSQKSNNSRGHGRVLPPRMVRHRQGNNMDSPPDEELSFGPPKPFTNAPVTSSQAPTKQMYNNSSSSNPNSRSYSPKSGHRGSPTNMKSNPIASATANTFQPPYQHVLDRAQTKPTRKSNSNPNIEKNKTKKSSMKEKDANELVDSLLTLENFTDVKYKIIAAKIPKRHMTMMCEKLCLHALKGSDLDRENMCKLIEVLVKEGAVSDENLLEAINSLFEKLKNLETEMPRIKSLMASLLSHAVSYNLVMLSQVAEGLEGGYNFPLFLLMLQHMSKAKGRDWLSSVVKESKVEVIKMLPEVSQNKKSMLEILEMKNLSFLFPLLHMEARLAAQLSTDATPQVVYRWIKDNVDLELHADPGFISVLMTSCLQYITKQASMAPGIDHTQTAPKEIQEKEKSLLSGIKVILQKFIHDKPGLQLRALYAVQVFCHAAKFPKGLMLRLFDMLYHEDIIDEEIFLKWKEDVNDEFPGKGKSLFQVNSWLTWLEEADTEDEDDED